MRTGTGEWITRNLCECSCDARYFQSYSNLSLWRSVRNFTRQIFSSTAFCVVFLVCCAFSTWNTLPSIFIFDDAVNWGLVNLLRGQVSKDFPQTWSFCSTSVSPSAMDWGQVVLILRFLQFQMSNLDIFVDLGLSRQHSRLWSRSSQCKVNHWGCPESRPWISFEKISRQASVDLSLNFIRLSPTVFLRLKVWLFNEDEGGESRIYLQGLQSILNFYRQSSVYKVWKSRLKLQVLVIGELGSGKTSLIKRYIP